MVLTEVLSKMIFYYPVLRMERPVLSPIITKEHKYDEVMQNLCLIMGLVKNISDLYAYVAL